MCGICFFDKRVDAGYSAFSFFREIRKHAKDVAVTGCDDQSACGGEREDDQIVNDDEKLSGSAGIPGMMREFLGKAAQKFKSIQEQAAYLRERSCYLRRVRG